MRIHVIDLDFLQLQVAIGVFVVETSDGPVLVETGPHATFPHLLAALEKHGFSIEDFRYVLLTHIHFDHAGAAWAFARAGATVFVHPVGLPHLAAPEKLYNSARMIYGDAMDRLWGAMEPIPEQQLYAPRHGESIQVGGLTFTAWYTPGHATHHIAWQAEAPGAESVVFTGDVAGVKPVRTGIVAPPCPPPDIHIEDWQESIRLLRDLPAETLYLTHFGAVRDKQAHLAELEQNLLEWSAWMEPHFRQQTPVEIITPLFQNFVREKLELAGIHEADQARYEAANPAFMSVAGLLRYWKKRQ